MTRVELEAVIQNKADIAEQMSDWTEDLFQGTFLEPQMIENDPYRLRVLETQRKAVNALRDLRRELEACKVAIAYKATPEGAKASAEYGKAPENCTGITIEYTVRKVEPAGAPDGNVATDKVQETLPTLKEAEARAREVLHLDSTFGAVCFWDSEGESLGFME